jgi:hypothetical protein
VSDNRGPSISNRLLRAIVVAAVVVLPICGCSGGPGASHGPLALFSDNSEHDEALRKKVEADNFPTAKQAGLASATPDQ